IPERPHRLSRILEMFEKLEPVPLELLEPAAATVATSKRHISIPALAARAGSSELEAFIAAHLDARVPVPYKDGRKWPVICPFNNEHTTAAVFEAADGTPGFHCLHDSCSDKHWRTSGSYSKIRGSSMKNHPARGTLLPAGMTQHSRSLPYAICSTNRKR